MAQSVAASSALEAASSKRSQVAHGAQVDCEPQDEHGNRAPHRNETSIRIVVRYVAIYVSVFAVFVYSIFPIYWMFLSSLRPQERLFQDTSLVFWPPDLSSYISLLQLTDYRSSFFNSVVLAAGTIILATTISAFIAYGATRLRFRGKTVLVVSLLFAYMFPPLMLAIPMASVFQAVGLANSLPGLLIAHLSISLPLGTWLLWGFFKSMPFELEEAAMVDGCSQFGAFIKVVLPLSVPGLITVGIFTFLLSWSDYVFALILIMNDQNETLPVALASMIGAQELRWGEILAGASLIALPLFFIFIFCYRYFVAGLTAGALKG